METAKKGIKAIILRKVLPSLSISTLLLVFLGFVILAAAISSMMDLASSRSGGVMPLPESVEAYRPMMIQACANYGLEDYVDLLLAIMAQESGGMGLDPMQSSESPYNTRFPNRPGGITDPAYSIECGVQMFKNVKEKAGVESPFDMPHIKLALQGYNFGEGYITWALGQPDAGYTQENAIQFSQMKAQELGWESYGDINYVNNVLRYYTGAGGEAGAGTGQFTWPVPGHTRMSRGMQFGAGGVITHRGIDITAPIGTNIVAADGGTVTIAMNGHYSYGNYIEIDHGNGFKTVYAHCVGLAATQGQAVAKGEIIAYVGSTGNSTGPHLHFEVSLSGILKNPLEYL